MNYYQESVITGQKDGQTDADKVIPMYRLAGDTKRDFSNDRYPI